MTGRHTKSMGWIVTLLLSITLFACNGEPPKLTESAFNRLEFYSGSNANGLLIRDAIVADINKATTTVDMAAQNLADPQIANALKAAQDRGVTVRFVGDVDSAADAGYVAIEQAKIPTSLGDGELKYLPEPTITTLLQSCSTKNSTIDVSRADYTQCTRREIGLPPGADDGLMIRPGTMNTMTNTFVVIDGLITYNLATPNTGQDSLWVGWRAHSQDLAIAYTREFQQMFGGVFATTLDIYNGPVKSTVHGAVYDSRIPSDRPGRKRQLLEGYLTDNGLMSIHFNPQQRLVKEMLDEIYRAKGSVYLMTNEIQNEYVIDALRYKGKYFDVQLLVHANATIPDKLKNSEVTIKRAPASLTHLPTTMLLNVSKGKNEKLWPRAVCVMSHSFLGGPPFRIFKPAELGEQIANDIVRVYPSDVFVDGNMWIMREPNTGRSSNGGVTADSGYNIYEEFNTFWKTNWNKGTDI